MSRRVGLGVGGLLLEDAEGRSPGPPSTPRAATDSTLAADRRGRGEVHTRLLRDVPHAPAAQAAVLDGVGAWGVFWKIVMPMSRGPLITIGLTTTVWAWNDYLWPLLTGRDEAAPGRRRPRPRSAPPGRAFRWMRS
ncbi:ABC transporter permease subunit [Streptomyces sp. NPDC001904]|uniref:ABC transporter permease subunit n=1 Tax=Streptomyces sp. NPDC001904 TaxID=3154531 RepID=UPI00333225C6